MYANKLDIKCFGFAKITIFIVLLPYIMHKYFCFLSTFVGDESIAIVNMITV